MPRSRSERRTGIEYFSEDVFPEVEYELLLGHEDLIDGVAPAIVEPLAVQNVTTRQSEPRVTLFASSQAHLGAFGDIRRHDDGEPQYLNDLQAGEVFLNSDAAEELQAAPGHELRLYAEGDAMPVTVRAIVDYEGTGTDGASLLSAARRRAAASPPRRRDQARPDLEPRRRARPAPRSPTRSSQDRRPGREAARARGRPGQAGRARQGRRRGQRVHVALHDVRQLLDLRRRPADLPDLRDARRRAAG